MRPKLPPATAAVRRAVRGALTTLGDRSTASSDAGEAPLVLVALSGGPDSVALAAATAFEARRTGVRAGAVIIDHGLQEGSDAVAQRTAELARTLELDPVIVSRVDVGDDGGPEAAARDARYAALRTAAVTMDAAAVLLGHTLDDQAETVLLGLARGSGAASLAGMAADTNLDGIRMLRPLLTITREQTVQACADASLAVWEDPHNLDDRFARVRVRKHVLPTLERELGPGIREALTRTADQLREDTEALDHFAHEQAEDLAEHAEGGLSLSVRGLAANPAALRQRIIRLAVDAEFGVALTRTHTLAIAALVTHWRGQGPVDVPGVRVDREGDRLVFRARDTSEEH